MKKMHSFLISHLFYIYFLCLTVWNKAYSILKPVRKFLKIKMLADIHTITDPDSLSCIKSATYALKNGLQSLSGDVMKRAAYLDTLTPPIPNLFGLPIMIGTSNKFTNFQSSLNPVISDLETQGALLFNGEYLSCNDDLHVQNPRDERLDLFGEDAKMIASIACGFASGAVSMKDSFDVKGIVTNLNSISNAGVTGFGLYNDKYGDKSSNYCFASVLSGSVKDSLKLADSDSLGLDLDMIGFSSDSFPLKGLRIGVLTRYYVGEAFFSHVSRTVVGSTTSSGGIIFNSTTIILEYFVVFIYCITSI